MTTIKSPPPEPGGSVETEPRRKKVSTHWLYIAVIVAVVAGTAVGLIFGKDAACKIPTPIAKSESLMSAELKGGFFKRPKIVYSG